MKRIILIAVFFLLTSCYGTHCVDIYAYHNRIMDSSWSPDGDSVAFLYKDVIKKDNIPYMNITIYKMNPDGSNLQSFYTSQIPIETMSDGNINYDSIILKQAHIKYLENNKIALYVLYTYKYSIIGDNNQVIDYDIPPGDTYTEEFLDKLTLDGKYIIIDDSNLFNVETQKKTLLKTPKDINADTDNVIIRTIRNSKKIVLKIKNSSYLADLDTQNSQLINYKKIDDRSDFTVVAEKDNMILAKINDDFYLRNLTSNAEEKINFTDIDKEYKKDLYERYYFFSPDLKNIISLETDGNNASLIKMNIYGQNKINIIDAKSLPPGDKIQYKECSTSTL